MGHLGYKCENDGDERIDSVAEQPLLGITQGEEGYYSGDDDGLQLVVTTLMTKQYYFISVASGIEALSP